MTKTQFRQIQADDDIREVIKSAFDLELNIDGGWGYDRDDAIVIHELPVPLIQLQHTLSSIRAHLEMNMTLPKEKRFGAININELKREQKDSGASRYDIVTFEISAMREETYAKFIQEYKLGQSASDFDIQEHFKRRKEETLIREEVFWFDISDIKS